MNAKDPIIGRAAWSLPAEPPEWIMYMPGGAHTITARQGDEARTVTILIDAESAAVLQRNLTEFVQAGQQMPFFDFDHENKAASAWPKEFAWRDGENPGVYCRVEWSSAGRDAITGKTHRAFSPTFYIDDGSPARVIGCAFDMGGLVNDPAFRQIKPIWSRNAANDTKPQPGDRMTPEEKAALEAKTQQDAVLAANQRADDLKKQLEAKNAEIEAAQKKLEAARKTEADRIVADEVARGALPAQDTALHAKWAALIMANPDNAALLRGLPGNSAVQAGRIVTAKVVSAGTDNVLMAFSGIKDPNERGKLYRKEIKARLDAGERLQFNGLPIEATNTLGTLVGNIISMRTLDLTVAERPMLDGVFKDFSPEPAKKGQSIITRGIGLPTVQDFGGTVSDTADTDYTVTLDQMKEVRWTYTAAEILGTSRDLIKEHAEAAAIALGNSMVDAVAALFTTAFTGVTTAASSTIDYSTLNAITKSLNNAGAPGYYRWGWVDETVAEALRNDELIVVGLQKDQAESAYAHFKGVGGFHDIWEYPDLTGKGTTNLTAFFGSPSSCILASRAGIVTEAYSQFGYAGVLEQVIDPVTGLTAVHNQWVDQSTLAINDRMILLYGAARGVVAHGWKIKSS